MTIRVLVNGAQGKMGQLTAKTIAAHPDFELVTATSREHDLAAEIQQHQPQIVIDFTNAASVLNNLEIIINAGVHPVIGTSGLLKKQIEPLQKRCAQNKLGGIIAPNFSLGAVLLIKQAQDIARYFPHVEIIEMHHTGKLDSPSGTAVYTAERLAEARTEKPALAHSKETIPGARGANYQEIPIHAIRLPGLVASQQILFGGAGETITLRHDTLDRHCFMPGVILACQRVGSLERLVYGLEWVL